MIVEGHYIDGRRTVAWRVCQYKQLKAHGFHSLESVRRKTGDFPGDASYVHTCSFSSLRPSAFPYMFFNLAKF